MILGRAASAGESAPEESATAGEQVPANLTIRLMGLFIISDFGFESVNTRKQAPRLVGRACRGQQLAVLPEHFRTKATGAGR